MLIAALLELKSRLMLPREEEELLDVEPGEAAEELLARMLEARRYRARRRAPARPARRRGGRALPLGAAAAARCARPSSSDAAARLRRRPGSGAALGGLLRRPPQARPRATSAMPRCRVAERLRAPAHAAAPRRRVRSTRPCAAPTA